VRLCVLVLLQFSQSDTLFAPRVVNTSHRTPVLSDSQPAADREHTDTMPKLFDDDDNVDDLKVSKKFASQYEQRKEREQLTKLKQQYQDEDEDDDDTDEDSDAEEITADNERDFLRTLSLLKSNDKRVYDPKLEFFHGSDSNSKPKQKKDKPVFLKDVERREFLERGSQAFLSDDEEEDDRATKSRKSKAAQFGLVIFACSDTAVLREYTARIHF
jgi:hypothetical protein